MSVNDITFLDTRGHAVVPGLLRIVGQAISRYVTYRQALVNIATLRSMGERELKDIGVNRCEVDRIANQARAEAIDTALRSRPGSLML